jgi:hypothetical protein
MKSFFPFTSKPLPVQLVSASIPPLSTHVLETWVNGGYNSGLPSTFLQTFTLTNFRGGYGKVAVGVAGHVYELSWHL